MTHLQQFLTMLSTSKEDFEKSTMNGHNFTDHIVITNDVAFTFDKEGNLEYVRNQRPKPEKK